MSNLEILGLVAAGLAVLCAGWELAEWLQRNVHGEGERRRQLRRALEAHGWRVRSDGRGLRARRPSMDLSLRLDVGPEEVDPSRMTYLDARVAVGPIRLDLQPEGGGPAHALALDAGLLGRFALECTPPTAAVQLLDEDTRGLLLALHPCSLSMGDDHVSFRKLDGWPDEGGLLQVVELIRRLRARAGAVAEALGPEVLARWQEQAARLERRLLLRRLLARRWAVRAAASAVVLLVVALALP